MDEARVTLQDIANKVGVSPSTVQRALYGIDGVGRARRDEIRKIAETMGYRRNLSASALKTGSRTVAVILPEPVGNNRFYARFLWEGALRCSEKYKEFNLNVVEFTYVRTHENHAAKLREAFDSHGDRLDGVLTMGTSTPEAEEVFSEFAGRGVPVVFVGTDARECDRVCCVRTYDEMAGRMAADLLINFASPKKHSKIVMTGDFTIADQFLNAQGFERHLLENGPPLEILKLSNDPDLEVVEKGIREMLESGLDICAVYATSSRNTVPMCRAAMYNGARGDVRIIGSDIFPESIEFLRNRVLDAIIHKRPSDQAYQAMQTLVNVVIKGEAAERDTVQIDSVIVMKSNLECFL